MTPSDREGRKRRGVFYTPEPVAGYMARSTLRAICDESAGSVTPRVVDPACGDGALLWPVYQFLCERLGTPTAPARLELIQHSLFGVDLDGVAIKRLRQRFRDDLADGVSDHELNSVLDRNLRCGNAVAGHGWEPPVANATTHASTPDQFHWSEQFPDVLLAGGFDVVIANPPYRRERGAKSDHFELEQSPLAESRRQARMDLWHYFFHRSLDLLRPGGLLTLIVNSYWTTSEAGQPLIERMALEATPLEFVLLDDAPVFPGVGGRHLIARMRKGITDEPCEIFQLRDQHRAEVGNANLWQALSNLCPTLLDPAGADDPFALHSMPRADLFHGGRLNLRNDSGRHFNGTWRTLPASVPTLPVASTTTVGDLFEVRQGIAENPPRVTRRQAAAHPELVAGEGVFVLSSTELDGLQLSAAERQLARPYYSAAEISKFWQPPPARQWLLYLTRHTASDLAALPRIQQHLSRFRPILEQRRETRLDRIAWWHLHWPRESRLFERPRILAVQMVSEPRFSHVETPTYVGFAVNLIVDRSLTDQSINATSNATNWSLESVAVILNSRWAADWFDTHAKRRGVNLDITGSTLKQFPLPEISPSVAEELLQLGRRRMAIGAGGGVDASHEVGVIEVLIDELLATPWHHLRGTMNTLG